MTLSIALAPCSLLGGTVAIAVGKLGLNYVCLLDSPEHSFECIKKRFPTLPLKHHPLTTELEYVLSFINAPHKPKVCDIPLDIQGTGFQKKVWDALLTVPAGHTASYKDIAVKIGYPKAIRAVANACGANPLGIIIPCHRIIKSNGDIGGYAWGQDRKLALLNREKIIIDDI